MISPIGKLHEALVAQRRIFLENAEARTYQRAKEIHPLPLNIQDPTGGDDEYLWPYIHFLPNKNHEIEQIRKDFEGPDDRYMRKMKKKYPVRPSLWTSEAFSAELIKFWGYSGKEWIVSEHVFESFFPEDESQKIVKTHWFIPSDKRASAIEQKAINTRLFVDPAIKKIEELPNASHYENLRNELLSAIHGNNPQWQPGIVEWGYLKLMDYAIRDIAILAREIGDNPFLSFITSAEFNRLVIDVQNFKLIWQQQEIKIGENQSFWLLYTLGEYYGEWVPLSDLARLANAENSEDSLKQVVYHLRKDLLKDKPWNKIATAIESGKKVYRLKLAQEIRLIP